MPAITKTVLHRTIIEALGTAIESVSELDSVPLRLRVRGLGDLAIYAFTLTSPPGGRPTGEYKIQLILPDQERGARGQLLFPPEVFTAVVGWSPEEQVFALWDAYAHQTFAYSQNLQVKGEAIWSALSRPIGICERRLRSGRGLETVVACRPEHFVVGIRSRITHSARRIEELANSI